MAKRKTMKEIMKKAAKLRRAGKSPREALREAWKGHRGKKGSRRSKKRR